MFGGGFSGGPGWGGPGFGGPGFGGPGFGGPGFGGHGWGGHGEAAAPVSEGTGADPAQAGAASDWSSVPQRCCSTGPLTPSNSSSAFQTPPKARSRRRKRSWNSRSVSWPAAAS